MIHKIYLSLGSNIGNKRDNLNRALELLSEKIDIKRKSSFYETEPVDYKDQNWFLNIVVEGETELDPFELLGFTQKIEKSMKRIKTVRFGPRNIDVDILLFDDISINTDDLTIPHPRMLERAFVMAPLNEIAKDLMINGKNIDKILKQLEDQKIIRKED